MKVRERLQRREQRLLHADKVHNQPAILARVSPIDAGNRLYDGMALRKRLVNVNAIQKGNVKARQP